MPRSHPRPLALALSLAAATIAAPLLVGCSPAAGPLADPREIVSRSVQAVAAARSFHYDATLEGHVPLPAVGAAEAAPLDLAGTTIVGDVDVAGASGTAVLEIPGLGPAFDAVVVGQDLYVRIGFLGGGYTRTSATGSPLAFLSNPAATLAGIDETLTSLPEAPRKEGDRDCGDSRCYVVILAVPAGSVADLPGLLGGLLGGLVGGSLGSGFGGLGGLDGPGGLLDASGGAGFPIPSFDPSVVAGAGTAELLVRIDDLRPYSMAVRGATAGAPAMRIVFRDWDRPLTIAAPTP